MLALICRITMLWKLLMKTGLAYYICKYVSIVDTTFRKSKITLGKFQTKQALSIKAILLLENSAYIKIE